MRAPGPRPAAPGAPPALAPAPAAPAAPVRDRATWIVYASLAIYGYCLYGLGPALDALRDELDVSRSAIGLAGSAFAVGAVVAAIAAAPVLLRFPHGAILRGGLVGLAAGTLMLTAAGPLPAVIAATFVLGVAGTAILVVVPLVVEVRQPAARAATLAEANVGAATAGVLAPVAVGAAILVGAGWRAGALLVLIAIVVVVLVAAARHFEAAPESVAGSPPGSPNSQLIPAAGINRNDAAPPGSPGPQLSRRPAVDRKDPAAPGSPDSQLIPAGGVNRNDAATPGPPDSQVIPTPGVNRNDPPPPGATPTRLPRGFWRWWSVLVLVVGVEFCMAFWATDFLREEAGVGRGPASAALGLFVGGMAAGRLVGGRLAVARDPLRLLTGALALTAVGFALFWSTGAALPSLAGLVVTGLGVAMLFPLTLSLAMASAPGLSEAASARASLAGGVAVLLAPYALATLADAIGVRAAFLIVLVFLATAVIVVRGGAPTGPVPESPRESSLIPPAI